MLARRRVSQIARNTRPYSHISHFLPAKRLDGTFADVTSSDVSEPTVFPRQFLDLPAIKNWFSPIEGPSNRGVCYQLNTLYLGRHGSLLVPLEYTRYDPSGGDVDGRKAVVAFESIHAPLSLLLSHMSSEDYSQQLYLAQCSINDLPSDLQADLPFPELISRLGRGDIYASSIWMGRPPTTTPLHRDPNPNLFVQLVGKKIIRLMRPKQGRHLYDRLSTQMGHAHLRGEEMMVGEERERLHDAVWNEREVNGVSASGVEAELEGGDGLYIPLGWWHAVPSFRQKCLQYHALSLLENRPIFPFAAATLSLPLQILLIHNGFGSSL